MTKKLLMIVALALGYSGFSYGMDDLKRYIADQDWSMILFNITDATAEQLPQSIQALLDATTDFNAADDKDRYLIDRWLVWYADDELSDQQRLNLRTGLKELIKHNKIDSDPKGRDFNVVKDDEEMQFALAMLEQICQEIRAEKASTEKAAAPTEIPAPQKLVKTAFNKKYMWGGLIAVCAIAAGCMLYRWYTQKVDKDQQEEDANQDGEHMVVSVHTQNPVAV